MFPCCILIMFVLLHIWGAKEKAAILWRYIRTGKTGISSGEGGAEQSIREALKETQREYSVFKKNKEGHTDGRTKIIDLQQD